MGACTSTTKYLEETQITFGDKNHDLDNNDNFSPDGKWLVFDTRTVSGGIGGCASIERVNTQTGEVQVLFNIPDNKEWGPGVGAVSYHPIEEKVIFIHGMSSCTKENPYQQWRRTGVIVNTEHPNIPIYMDSRDITPPFTPGALRGGTHRHEWRRDGKWVGYTYNDAVMKHLEDSTGVKWNLRTVAVSVQNPKNKIGKDATGENVQGEWFSAVVVRVVPNPVPGSDEISNAASDSWVGTQGYRKADGSWQNARAFLGKVTTKEGKQADELFVVDIPDSIDVPGEYGPLQGTQTTFPMPPKGTLQRRLTHTAETQYPGCGGVVRSSFDGQYIAYQAKDKAGIQQIFLIQPAGGDPIQLTFHQTDVQSGVRWSPDGKKVYYVWNNSIVICEISGEDFGKRFKILTASSAEAPSNIVLSNDGNVLAFNRNVKAKDGKEEKKQIFIIPLN